MTHDTNGQVLNLSYGTAAQFVLSAYDKIKEDKYVFKQYKKALKSVESSYCNKEISLTQALQEECNLIVTRFSDYADNAKGHIRIGNASLHDGDKIHVASPSWKAMKNDLFQGQIGTIIAAHRYDI
jgi:hypothetical protein